MIFTLLIYFALFVASFVFGVWMAQHLSRWLGAWQEKLAEEIEELERQLKQGENDEL